MRLITLLFSLLIFSPATMAWKDCNWAFRSLITVTNNDNEALTDFNVPVVLSAADLDTNYDWSLNGVDFRIYQSTDENQTYDFYIEDWNASNQSANLYVQMNIPANSSLSFYLYHGNSSAADVSKILSFEKAGIKFHTRRKVYDPTNPYNSNLGPGSYNQIMADFNSLTDNVSGYDCDHIENFSGVRNRTAFDNPGSRYHYIAYSESYFEVLSGEEGPWSFRYGSDFTYGGELRLNGQTLQQRWNQDLWWGLNWNNTSEILIGSIHLTAGYHRLEIIGAEACCDGDLTVQFQRPGGTWQTFNTSIINVRSRTCPINPPSANITVETAQLPNITLTSNVDLINDAIAGNNGERALKNSLMEYTYRVTNNTNASPGEDSLALTLPIPAQTKLMVDSASFSDGTGANSSGLTFNYDSASSTADDVEFSTDGTDFSYVPVLDAQGADANISHVRIHFQGRMHCAVSNTPTFTSKLQLLIL